MNTCGLFIISEGKDGTPQKMKIISSELNNNREYHIACIMTT